MSERCPLGVCDGSGFVDDGRSASPCECRRTRMSRVRLARARLAPARGGGLDRAPINRMDERAVNAARAVMLGRNAPGCGFWVAGPAGSAKTSLLRCVCSHLYEQGAAAAVVTQRVVLARLRAAADGSSVWKELQTLIDVDVLAVDDLGDGDMGPWGREQIALLLEERWEAERVTLLASALHGDDLAARVGETVHGRAVKVAGAPIVVAPL